MISIDFEDPFARKPEEEEGFIASQVPKPDFGRGPAIDLETGAPKRVPKVSIDFQDPFAPKKEVDWSPIRSPEDLRKEWEQAQAKPTEQPEIAPAEAVPITTATRRIQIPQATTMPLEAGREEPWLPVIGKSIMGGFGRITTGITGAARAEMELKSDLLARLLKLSPEETVEMQKKREATLGPTEDLSNIVTDYWTPLVGQNRAKHYASAILGSTIQSGATMLSGGAGLPLFGITSGGEKYRQLRQAGMDPEKAFAAALPVGISEAATEMIPFKFAKAVGLPLVKRMAGYIGSEIPGELINTIVEDAIDKVTVRPEMTWKDFFQDLVDTVIVTTGQSLLMGGASHIATRSIEKEQERAKARTESIEKLLQEAQARMTARQTRKTALSEEEVTLYGEPEDLTLREEEINQKSKEEVGIEPIPEELTKPPEETKPVEGTRPPEEEPPPIITKEPAPEPKGPPPQALDIEEETKGITEEDLKRIREELLGQKEGEEPVEKIPGIPPRGEKTPPPPRPVPPTLQELIDKKDVDSIIRRGGGMEWGINGFYLANELAEENVSIDDPDLLTKTGFTPTTKEGVPLTEEKKEDVVPTEPPYIPPGMKPPTEEITPIPEELTERPGLPFEQLRYKGEINEIEDWVNNEGRPGYRAPGSRGEPGLGSQSSTYENWMKNKGWTKKEVLRSIRKGKAGEKLGSKEAKIWKAVKAEARGRYKEGLGWAKKQKLEAIPTGDLEVGDRVKVRDEVLTVTEKDDEKIVIKDGQTYELDPYFDTITGRRISQGNRAKEGIDMVLDLAREYARTGLTVDDLMVGMQGVYRDRHPYFNAATSNLDADKLMADLKRRGFANLQELFDSVKPKEAVPEEKPEAKEEKPLPWYDIKKLTSGTYKGWFRGEILEGPHKGVIGLGRDTEEVEKDLQRVIKGREKVISTEEKPAAPEAIPTEEKKEEKPAVEQIITEKINPVSLSGLFENIVGTQELNKIKAQQIVADAFGVGRGELVGHPKFLQKGIDEAIEYAIVKKARALIDSFRKMPDRIERTFNALRDLYFKQPFLGSRTSTSIENQAYSTPVHIAYLMQEMAGVDHNTKVLDTTAGTGMLLTAANPANVTANELQPDRALILEDQGYTVTTLDALEDPVAKPKSQDVVILNPPFGSFRAFGRGRNIDGFEIKKKEHYITIMGLKAMKDSGRAAILVGGHNFKNGEMSYTDKVFLNYLYHNYNVVKNIDIPGKLYHRQGTDYDIRLIYIDGRKATPEGFAPGTEAGYQKVDNIEQLLDNVREVQDARQEELAGVAPAGAPGLGIREEGMGRPEAPRGRPEEGLPGPIRTEAPGLIGEGARGERERAGAPGELPTGVVGPREEREPGRAAPGHGERGRMARTEEGVSPIPEGLRQPGRAEGAIRIEEPEPGARESVEEGRREPEPERIPGTGNELLESVQNQSKEDLQNTLTNLKEETKPTETPTAEKTSKELLKEAGVEVTKGLEEAMKGLHELFGGGKVLGTGLTLDPDFYRKAKPHFKEAWKQFQAAGKTLKEFYQHFLKMFGEKIAPYLDRFILDMQSMLKGELQVEYEPVSKSPLVDETVIPTNQADATRKALENLSQRVGDIDEYVQKEMGYKSLADLFKALSGDQVDALALALDNIQHDSALIEDDATGLGKGRVAASVINWANRQGKKPIFFTEKPNLFSDLWRDTKGILKSNEFKPLIMASNATGAAIRELETGNVVFNLLPDVQRGKLYKQIQQKGQEALGNHSVLLTTYSQINRENNVQQQTLRALARDNYIILDESHNASGDSSNTGAYMRELLQDAKGVIYLSATWAKHPKNIPIYFRTDISKANLSIPELIEALKNGGIPLQEIISEMLTERGQLIHREKIYKDIPVDTFTDTENLARDSEVCDQMTEVMRDVIDFDREKGLWIKGMNKDIQKEDIDDVLGVPVNGGIVIEGKKVGDTVDTANFSATVHNAVRVLLMALKADRVATEAIAALKGDPEKGIESRKPFIAVSNTMETFIDDLVEAGELKVGDKFDINFGHILGKYLRRTLRFRVKPFDGRKSTVHPIPLEQMPETLRAMYRAVEAKIKAIADSTNLPGSPIDYIRQRIIQAGFQVGEITGRSFVADLTDPKKPVLRLRSEKEKANRNQIIIGYNNRPIDALIVNAAGAGGLSAHTDPDFKDQRERFFMGMQYELNIDTELQKMGRINRKGQTKLPRYRYFMTEIPAEVRPAAVHQRKMKSLLANTTSNPNSSLRQKDIPDMMNKHGDTIAKKWLDDNIWALDHIGWSADKIPEDNLIQKLSGRMAIQPVAIQKEFFESVEEEYNLYVQDLKAQGMYDLEVNFNDFKAVPISRELLVSGKDESNPFGQSSYLEEMSVVAPQKPYTREKLTDIINERLAGKSTRQYRDDFARVLETAAEGYIAKKQGEAQEKAQAKAQRQREKEQARRQKEVDKPREKGVLTEELETQIMGAPYEEQEALPGLPEGAAGPGFNEDTYREELSGIKHQLQQFVMGNTYQIGEMYGVLIGMKHRFKGGDPLAHSKIVMEFAVNNALQKLDVPLSRIGADEDSYRIYEESTGITDMWEALTPSEIREKRYFITGNILQGFAKTPKHSVVTRFTTEKGDRLRGILLPRSYQPQQHETVTLNIDQATKIAQQGETLQGQTVTLSKSPYTDYYMLVVPSSKAQGGQFFLDTQLVGLSQAKNFEKLGKNTMRATYGVENIPAVVKRLHELGETFSISRDTFKRLFPDRAQAKIVINEKGEYVLPPFVPTEEGTMEKSEAEKKAEQYARQYGLEGEEGELAITAQAAPGGGGAIMTPGARPTQREINNISNILQRILPRGVRFSFVEELTIDTRDPHYRQSILEWIARNPGVQLPLQIRIGGQTIHTNIPGQGLMSMIQVALKDFTGDTAAQIGYHEAWHAIQGMLLTNDEKRILRDRFKNDERIADEFADFSTNRKRLLPNGIRTIFQKIRDFIDALGNYLAGRGFRTVNDIFGQALAGQLRGQPRGPALPIGGIAAAQQAQQGGVPVSSNPYVEEEFEKAYGLDQATILDRAYAGVMKFVHSFTRHFPLLDRNRFGKVIDILRRYEQIPEYAKKTAYEQLREITQGFNKDQLKLFGRIQILRDLVRDIEDGLYGPTSALPFQYTSVQEIRDDLARFEAYMNTQSNMMRADQERKRIWADLRRKLIDAEILDEGRLDDDRYFHHQVLQYMSIKAMGPLAEMKQPYVGLSSPDVRLHKKGWQIARLGSAEAFNTSYLEAEFEVLSQATAQLETVKILDELQKAEDISGQLKREAKQFGLNSRDWKKMLKRHPGYVVWQPRKGFNFYMANTITDKYIKQVLGQQGFEIYKATGKVNIPGVGFVDIETIPVRRALAVGGRRTEWAIPEELAKTLDNFKDFKDEGPIWRLAQYIQTSWKQWTLLNPFRVVKYNLNNLSGDADIALAYDPKIVTQFAKQAAKDLWAQFRDKKLSQQLKKELDTALRLGVVGSGITVHEIPDISDIGIFKLLTGQKTTLIEKYWNTVKDFTNFRENVLRLAAFRYFKEQARGGNIVYGASKKEEIDKISNAEERSAKLARELIGDYGNISQAGQWLRRNLIPFYSWMEINAPRYVRMMRNLQYEQRGGAGRMAAVGTMALGRRGVKFSAQVLGLYALVSLWNALVFPDEDDEMKRSGRRELQLILGRRADGSIRSLRIQGALSDALQWFRLEDFPDDLKEVLSGKVSWTKKLSEAVWGPAERVYQAARPIEKAIAEAGYGKTRYPEIWKPRPIKDKTEHILKTFSLDLPYKYATRFTATPKPMRGGAGIGSLINDLEAIATYRTEPGEGAYYTILNKEIDFLRGQGEDVPEITPTKKSTILYYYKMAQRYGDKRAAQAYMEKYIEAGGTKQDLMRSIKKSHPLAILPIKYRQPFLSTLDEEDRKALETAIDWWQKIYGG